MSQQQRQVSKNSEWYDAALVADKPSRLGEVIFFLLLFIAVLAVVIFGAVDVWALGLLSLAVGSVAALWVADSWRRGEFGFNTSPLQISLLGLIGVGLIQLLPLRGAGNAAALLGVSSSAALSLAPFQTRLALVQLISYFIFFAAALNFISNQKRLRKAVVVVIIFGALMSLYASLQHLAHLEGIYGLRQTPDAFPFGSYVNRHHFAALLEMPIALTLALLFGGATTKDKRIFLVAAAAVMGITIILTGSRGALISLFAVLVFIIIVNLLKNLSGKDEISDETETKSGFRRNLTLIGGGLALIFGLVGAILMLGADDALMRSAGLTLNVEDVSNGRTHFWSTALKIIADYPLIGTGLDSFGMAYTRYDTSSGSLRVEQAHNDYLQILTDAGILGFACVASFIVFLFRDSIKIIAKSSDNFRRNTAVGALAGCFGIIVHSFFDFPLRTPANGYFFLIFAALATATISYPKLYRKRK